MGRSWNIRESRLNLLDTLVRFLETLTKKELFYDRGNHNEFLSMTQELVAPGELRSTVTFDFEFKNVEKQYESYYGINVKLRYF